jgi:hypothetical protein
MIARTTMKWLLPSWLRELSRPPRRLYQACRDWLRRLPRETRERLTRASATCHHVLERAPVVSRVLSLCRSSRVLLRFCWAYTRYARTGIVPPDAYPILPPAYMLTNGRLTDFLAGRLARRFPPIAEPEGSGIVPSLSASEHRAVLADLRRDGLHVFQRRLDPALCDELVAFARRTPCTPYGDHVPDDQQPILFDPSNPVAPAYLFDQQQLAEFPLVQRFLTDPTCLKLAQDYLGMEPILNIHIMWWSAPYKRNADRKAAQLFHFDLDRSKFLKFFVYLVDVGEDNGPHVFVRGTHVRKVRPLLRDGRIPDEDMFAHYPRDRAVTLTGPKGTMFAEDTRGFHKGTPVLEGTRLVFELEYVSDRFGRSEPVLHVNHHFDEAFRSWQERHPRVLCRFSSDETAKTTADLKMV